MGKDTMIDIPKKEAKNVFKINQDIIYEMIGNECRHRSRRQLRDVQIYILDLIYKCDLRCRKNNDVNYIGLNLYSMQSFLKKAGISPDAVRENLSRLLAMGLVVKEKVKFGNEKYTRAYYKINKNAFPCRYGKWIFLPTVSISHIYLIPCSKYPFCSCFEDGAFDPTKCEMPKQLNTLLKELPEYLNWLNKNITTLTPPVMDFEPYKRAKYNLDDDIGDADDYYDDNDDDF